ncbi:MAG: biopolymer transporter ExbD [Candidatus Sulfotelmatobacter sp.]
MKRNLILFLAASFLTLLYTAAQNPPQQRGISIQLATAVNAEAMPDADAPNAWIVTITADGGIYFGITPVTSEGLYYKMKPHARKLPKKLYLKVDAGTPYASIQQALVGIRPFFESVVLLTASPTSPTAGAIVPPNGIEVFIRAPGAELRPRIQLKAAGASALTINHEPVTWDLLPHTLETLLGDRKEKVVPVEVSGAAPFAQVVHVIDVCRSAGARVVLPLPTT